MTKVELTAVPMVYAGARGVYTHQALTRCCRWHMSFAACKSRIKSLQLIYTQSHNSLGRATLQ